jgi:hypothetical protein
MGVFGLVRGYVDFNRLQPESAQTLDSISEILASLQSSSLAAKADATVTRASAGRETVDGHSCQIENVTVSSPQLAGPMKMRFWEAEDLQKFSHQD